ncbi:hypothetical protein N806_28040 [Rhodococcus sp. P27]|nr:hypothetical protein N601_08010 [Rhodococcus erythropolis DN1]ERB54979.1 hypothetical protein N806_28040 [Rhodococcus sp. P27]
MSWTCISAALLSLVEPPGPANVPMVSRLGYRILV